MKYGDGSTCEFITSPANFFNAPEGQERRYICGKPATGSKAGWPVCQEHGAAPPSVAGTE